MSRPIVVEDEGVKVTMSLKIDDTGEFYVNIHEVDDNGKSVEIQCDADSMDFIGCFRELPQSDLDWD